MKKIFGIVIPLFIIVAILGLLLFTYSAGRKGLGCEVTKEPGVKAGMKDSQIWIDAFEKYKSMFRSNQIKDWSRLFTSKCYGNITLF